MYILDKAENICEVKLSVFFDNCPFILVSPKACFSSLCVSVCVECARVCDGFVAPLAKFKETAFQTVAFETRGRPHGGDPSIFFSAVMQSHCDSEAPRLLVHKCYLTVCDRPCSLVCL